MMKEDALKGIPKKVPSLAGIIQGESPHKVYCNRVVWATLIFSYVNSSTQFEKLKELKVCLFSN